MAVAYQQGRLWDDGALPEDRAAPARRAGARRRPSAPTSETTLPLWTEPPPRHEKVALPAVPPAAAPIGSGLQDDITNRPASPAPATPASESSDAKSRPLARRSGGGVRAAPKTAAPSSRSAATAARAAAQRDEGAEDEGMGQAAEWIETLLEEAGRSGGALRGFVRAFPPTPRWGEPWPAGLLEGARPAFAPTALSYAAALREVAAGRRRVRIEGRWADGVNGTILAGASSARPDGQLAWSILAIEP